LIAFAAQRGGCHGIYRILANEWTSVFLGYRYPDDLVSLAPPDPAYAAAARERAEAYDRDCLVQDRLHFEQGVAQDAAHVGLEHDRAKSAFVFMAPCPQGGVLDIRVGPGVSKTVYRVQAVGGEAKFTDQLIDWGNGFLWPVPLSAR
jgi:hypothetical protein